MAARKPHRRFGLGLTAFGALGATIVLAAPQAGAWPSGLTVSGTEHNVGCTYTLTATITLDRLTSVKFTDNGTELPGSPVTPQLLSNKVTIDWKPTTAGAHKLVVTQDLIPYSTTVDVSEANSFGSFGCALGGGLGGLIPSLSG